MDETIEEVLEHLRDYRETKSAVEADLKLVCEKIAGLESKVRHFSKTTGLKNFSGSGLSITISDKMRPRYDPDHWKGIVRWAVDTNNDHIIQRRITGAKLEELVDNGVALPEGLTLESYEDLSVRSR